MMNQLFNTERFSGMDRIGDQKFYTLSFEYKKRKMNMDKISLTVSKKFYLEDRKVWLDDMHMNMPINMGMDMGMGSMAMPTMNMDMMKMRVNKNLVVLAKQEIKLEPLGKHLMLIELDPLIRETHSSKIIFHSENCGNFDVVFKNEH